MCGKFTEVNQPKGRGCGIAMLMQSDFAVLIKAHHSSGAATFEHLMHSRVPVNI